MADMKRNAMPQQPAEIRRNNFSEVALGYTEDMAVAEAKRCLNCKNKPCTSGCPVGVKIPEFIEKVAQKDFSAAYDVLKSCNFSFSSSKISFTKLISLPIRSDLTFSSTLSSITAAGVPTLLE